MRKLGKRILLCAMAAALVWTAALLRDKTKLRQELIRFHVVANSDSAEDQTIKLCVRDAVMEDLQTHMAGIADVEAAKAYLRENLPRIQELANHTLQSLGVNMDATVKLCTERFETREYDTFTLPAGVYDALRITIGNGEGKNWWCVVFPAFCISAARGDFEQQAVGAGFSPELTAALETNGNTTVRFFFLDQLGKLENIFFPG